MRFFPTPSATLSALAAALLCACSAVGLSQTAVSFASEPPGARVLIDRRDSGFVTPCRMALESGSHRVDLELPGYAPASLRVERSFRTDMVLWRDMYIRPGMWRFPLWLNLEDAADPIQPRWTFSPGHVFVRLERATPR